MNIDKLGVMFQIHRATAARWLHSAREAVFTETRRLLQERLRLSPGEFDSLVRVLRSQLDLSATQIHDPNVVSKMGEALFLTCC